MSPRGVRALALASVLVLSATAAAAQQSVHFSLGVIDLETLTFIAPSLVFRPMDDLGVRPGAAALGLGGAWMARAEGPMAAGWNPAGIAETQGASLVFDGAFTRSTGSTTNAPPSFSIPGQGEIFTRSYNTNLKGGGRPGTISGAIPIWGAGSSRLVGALSWRSFTNVSFPEETVSKFVFGQITGFPVTFSLDRKERGSIESLAPALAYRFGPLAVGANLNFLSGRLRTSTSVEVATGAGSVPPGRIRFSSRYSGFVPDLGARVSIPMAPVPIALAARVTPGYTLRVEGGDFSSASLTAPGTPQVSTEAKLAGYEMDVPPSYSAGVAVRPLERLWVSADLNAHAWSETKGRYRPEALNDRFPAPFFPLHDVSTRHFGLEYTLLRRPWGEVPVRLGFHDVEFSMLDIDQSDFSRLDGDPLLASSDAVHGDAWSGGASFRSDRFSYDLGVESSNYQLHRMYFESMRGSFTNADGAAVTVDRKVTTIKFSVSYGLGAADGTGGGASR